MYKPINRDTSILNTIYIYYILHL